MNKDELRTIYKKKRALLTDETIGDCSAGIGDKIVSWLSEHPEIRHLHTFLPARNKKEIDTFSIIRRIATDFPVIRIVVPRMAAREPLLSHYLFTENTGTSLNRWGIPEPTGNDTIPARLIDAVLVPMLVCDRQGHRVGYGGGYYDRFLTECRPDTWKIGICCFEPVDKISDPGWHDIRLDACVTPLGFRNFGN